MNTTPSDTPSPAGHPLRVLCVDDNKDAADSEALLLQIMGYDALACYDGATALELAADFHPSVCLLDVNMPGMDGDELAQHLHERADERPPVCIAVTALNRADLGARPLSTGFARQVIKPAGPGQLLTAINDTRPPEEPS